MATKICSSTSTTDLYQNHAICSDCYSQTMTTDHNDDDYANYEEIYLQKPSICINKNNLKKSDQTVLCRINRYSIGCLTKPAYLLTN
ncbi:unnamed protein product [Rotaria sp. Silwood2]|nr:unnamed protein product [Rotaria sp. Silwood2]CAF2502971.1 unnamed protein product [Rotaria sp. Silwood2]CAF2900760.1 unnamed protein product [Rotaria sp. Silwood2]CAF3910763.1 unnamed protein product [Rotaria sp. Silwood2]CAF4085307.1 unnamed protein product [Rotaria sp. Silwood2]